MKLIKLLQVFGITVVSLTGISSFAHASTPPLVNPITVNIGATIHITPIDQNNNPIPISECVVSTAGLSPALVPTVATFSYDATGANITGVAPGMGDLEWICTAPGGGGAQVGSNPFIVTVPWSVTAVGDTSP